MSEPWGCSACGKQFRGLGTFDVHRVQIPNQGHPDYGRGCMGDEELKAKGYETDDKGRWFKPLTEEQAAKLSAFFSRQKAKLNGDDDEEDDDPEDEA